MKRKLITSLLVLTLIFTSIVPTQKAEAFYLKFYAKLVEVGGTAKINLYGYNGENVKWTLSNKKMAKITESDPDECTIKAKKAGTLYVNCKAGKKTKKIKVTIIPKSKITYNNFKKIKDGMSYNEVKKILGKYDDISSSYTKTEAEYQEAVRKRKEYGEEWADEVYYEQITYHWENPVTKDDIRVKFNDDSVIKKEFY